MASIRDEYRTAREGAVLFDLSDRGKIEVRGKDVVPWLHNLCTNDIRNLPAEGCEAFLTNHKAKAVAFVYVCRFPKPDEFLWLDVDSGVAGKVLQHLNKYIISEDVELADRTTEWGKMHLAGPRASEVYEQIAKHLAEAHAV